MITYVMLCGCTVVESKAKQIKILRPNGKFTYKIGCAKHKQTCAHRTSVCKCGTPIIASLSGIMPKQCKACAKEQKRIKEETWKRIAAYNKVNPRGQYCKKLFRCQAVERRTKQAFRCADCKRFLPVFPNVDPKI